jgi:hypothetical protein
MLTNGIIRNQVPSAHPIALLIEMLDTDEWMLSPKPVIALRGGTTRLNTRQFREPH